MAIPCLGGTAWTVHIFYELNDCIIEDFLMTDNGEKQRIFRNLQSVANFLLRYEIDDFRVLSRNLGRN